MGIFYWTYKLHSVFLFPQWSNLNIKMKFSGQTLIVNEKSASFKLINHWKISTMACMKFKRSNKKKQTLLACHIKPGQKRKYIEERREC